MIGYWQTDNLRDAMRFYDPPFKRQPHFDGNSNAIYEIHKEVHKILGKFNVMITDNGSNFLKNFRVSSPNELP
jgi:hypothetical protein